MAYRRTATQAGSLSVKSRTVSSKLFYLLSYSKICSIEILRSTFACEWLAYVEETGQYGVRRLQSLYSGSEAFVNIFREDHADQIDKIYQVIVISLNLV